MGTEAIRLFGSKLFKTNGIVVDTAEICRNYEVLGLYFSSIACPTCISFTSELLKFYDSRNGHSDMKLEIVYVSSDADENTFEESVKSMPWLALPFSETEKKVALMKAFRVKNIPSLILIDSASCDLITPNGKSAIFHDPQGKSFPWKISHVGQLLDELVLVKPNKEKIDFHILTRSIKGIYFAAHWCPPCKAFTPALVRLYKKLQKNGYRFEVIYVSSDLGEPSFEQYFGTMPWLAVPYEDEWRRKELAHFFGIGGIPNLVILDEDNTLITKEGRLEVNDDQEGEDFPWRPKLVEELSEKHVTKLNEEKCLILFTASGCQEKELDAAHYLLLPVAEEYRARTQRAKTEGTMIPHLHFFYAGDAEICDSVRDAVQANDRIPFVVILDMAKNHKYVLENKKELSSDVIGKFMRDFLASKLAPHRVEQ